MESSFPDDPDLGMVKLGFGGGVDVNTMFPRWKPNELELEEDAVGPEVVTTGIVDDGHG